MLAVNDFNLQRNLKTYFDRAADDFETVIITRENNKNVVLMGLDEYNNLMENLFIMGNETHYKNLIERKRRLDRGEGTEHELIEE